MQLSVALVPPDHVRAAVAGIVERVPGAARELALVPEGALRIPLIGLGNLTRPDADQLCEELAHPVSLLDVRARIGLAGVWALEKDGDPSIALNLVGDTDPIAEVARSLPPLVTDHGFFVDRRRFATRLNVASVTAATTLPVLEKVVEALGRYESPMWDVECVDVVYRVHHDTGATFEILASLSTVVTAPV